MDYCFDHHDEELAAVLGQGFPDMISILSSNTIPTIAPIITQHNYYNPVNKDNKNDSKLPRIVHGVINDDDHQASNLAPIFPHQVINNDFPWYHKDGSVVSEISKCQGLNIGKSEKAKRSSQPTKKKTRTRPPKQVYEHIIAERRRREQLSQLFVALSAIVPGLKKTDKTSILGDAITYLKNLKQKVENLEQKPASGGGALMDSGRVTVKKTHLFVGDEGSSDGGSAAATDDHEPEIEVRIINNSILIRVHCAKQKGVLSDLLGKVESLNMVVANTNVTPFGDSALDVTIVAETEEGFSLTGKEVATALRATLRSA